MANLHNSKPSEINEESQSSNNFRHLSVLYAYDTGGVHKRTIFEI